MGLTMHKEATQIKNKVREGYTIRKIFMFNGKYYVLAFGAGNSIEIESEHYNEVMNINGEWNFV